MPTVISSRAFEATRLPITPSQGFQVSSYTTVGPRNWIANEISQPFHAFTHPSSSGAAEELRPSVESGKALARTSRANKKIQIICLRLRFAFASRRALRRAMQNQTEVTIRGRKG